jgi:transposase
LEAPFVQRVEIISAKAPRRRWSEDEKRRLVSEAFAPGAVVSHVARRHEVAESCLFSWRKRFAPQSDELQQEQPRLIPVMVEPPPLMPQAEPPVAHAYPAIITWADGTRLEVPVGYPASALKALIAALRPTR